MIPAHTHYRVKFDHQWRAMCCPGCEAVCQTIIDIGLVDFYRKRTAFSSKGELIPDELENISQSSVSSTTSDKENHQDHDLILEGISCSACIWLLEHHLRQLPGIITFKVNHVTRRAHIKSQPSLVQLEQILQAIQEIGYHAYPYDPGKQYLKLQQERKDFLSRLGVAAFCGMQVMMITLGIYVADANEIAPRFLNLLIWASAFLTLPVVFFSAVPFFRSAWRDIKNHSPGMDVPVALGVGLAFIASLYHSILQQGETYYESVCMFVIFLLLARYIEFLTRWHSISSSERITQATTVTAKRINSDGQIEIVPAKFLQIGDNIQINPGAVIPTDSIVNSGSSYVDESILTGENKPIQKQIGSTLLGGSHNLESGLVASVSCISENSTLSTISRMVERAQAEKPSWVTLADRYASWFVIAVIILTGLSALHGWWVADPNWFSTALSVLVVTCPCALSLATPTAYTATMSRLFKQGIVVTNGHALERLATVNHVIFDKTGTLTDGAMSISNCHLYTHTDQQFAFDIAATLESHSDHPIAQAFSQNKSRAMLQAQSVEHKPGQGISGQINGSTYYLGSKQLMSDILEQDTEYKPSTMTRIFLANESQLIAHFDINDSIRDGAKPVISWLNKRVQHISLLSGDQHAAVAWLAKQVGINDYTAEASPSEKLNIIEQLQQKGDSVAMIGDGINDAPVLAKANVSISVSNASQLARASSDILLLGHDMNGLKQIFILAKQTKRIIVQNMSWALVYNIGALPMALTGNIEPWQAALGMSISSLVVVLNSFRIHADHTAQAYINQAIKTRQVSNG
ncbi:MAG: ATPase P [Piscirickettsiaceae bacterium]|nr:MAG: ATPase P [Piscirickettsiaceae bacterium]